MCQRLVVLAGCTANFCGGHNYLLRRASARVHGLMLSPVGTLACILQTQTQSALGPGMCRRCQALYPLALSVIQSAEDPEMGYFIEPKTGLPGGGVEF